MTLGQRAVNPGLDSLEPVAMAMWAAAAQVVSCVGVGGAAKSGAVILTKLKKTTLH